MLARTDARLVRTDARLGGYGPRLRATLDGWERSLRVWPEARFARRESHRVWRAELFVKRKEVLHKQKPQREWPELPRVWRAELFVKRKEVPRKQKPYREWPELPRLWRAEPFAKRKQLLHKQEPDREYPKSLGQIEKSRRGWRGPHGARKSACFLCFSVALV
jgi:hypothetical protein